MSKTIKVEDEVYDKLDKFRGKNETFSQAVAGLIFTRESLCNVLNAIEGSMRFREWQFEQLQKQMPPQR